MRTLPLLLLLAACSSELDELRAEIDDLQQQLDDLRDSDGAPGDTDGHDSDTPPSTYGWHWEDAEGRPLSPDGIVIDGKGVAWRVVPGSGVVWTISQAKQIDYTGPGCTGDGYLSMDVSNGLAFDSLNVDYSGRVYWHDGHAARLDDELVTASRYLCSREQCRCFDGEGYARRHSLFLADLVEGSMDDRPADYVPPLVRVED